MEQACPVFVLGLTGSIGMGKSTVTEMFRSLGVPVWSADQAVHELYAAGGAAVSTVDAGFPGSVVAGAVDRQVLSKLVVGNEAAIKKLESIVHPLVAASRLQFILSHCKNGQHGLVLVDIPLLYETGGDQQVDAVAVVSAPEAVQRQRVLARPGMTEEKLDAILARQMPDAEKRACADYVIDTSVPLTETQAHVAALVKALMGRPGQVYKDLQQKRWPAHS